MLQSRSQRGQSFCLEVDAEVSDPLSACSKTAIELECVRAMKRNQGWFWLLNRAYARDVMPPWYPKTMKRRPC